MTAHAQALRLRLFLEGIEVPVIAANIQTAPNSPAVATIQIPPLPAATKMHPRTTVHLFFLDLYKSSSAINDTSQQGPSTSERRASQAEREQERLNDGASTDEAIFAGAADKQNDQWRMLFGGEIVGFTWTKNTSNRSIILQCEDWSNYWDYAFQANNTGIFGPGLKAVFSGANTNMFTDFLRSEGEVITNIVRSGKCNTFPELKGLSAGIIRLVEAIGGSYYSYPRSDGQKPARRYGGQNTFFSYNELRLHITQMIGTFEGDPTSERILRRAGYGPMFRRAIGGQGGQVSIRKAMIALTKIIFYEMYPQPCPKYRPGGWRESQGTKRVKLQNHPTYGRFATAADEGQRGMQNLIESIASFFAGEDDTTTPYQERVRLLADEHIRELAHLRRTLLRTRAQMRTVPQEAIGAFSSAERKIGEALSVAQQLQGESFSNTQQSAGTNLNKLQKLYGDASDELNKVRDVDTRVSGSGSQSPAQLYQQVFRPDVWFASPPRCNVLFPELYDTFSYQRMFLKEPTRFMLKTNDEFFGEDILFDKFYFAPQAGGQSKSFQDIRSGKLFDHEKFTGILPVFEKMGEFNIFASKGEGRRAGSGKVGLAQRSANFLYFRHRFNARRATVRGKFNPYVAVGCPGLVIDQYVDRETIDRHNRLRSEQNVGEIEANEILGTNFLGNFTQVVHQVSQAQPSGVTDITMTFPRQVDESVEFLGSIPEEARVRRKVDGANAVRSTDVAALSPPKPYSLGPNKGRITNVQDVTEQYKAEARRLPTFHPDNRRSSEFAPVEVPIGIPVAAIDEGNNQTLTALLGGEEVEGVFAAYRLTEEIPRYKLEEILLPAEEYVRPGWYGEIWTNSQIGSVWQDLFSTGSLTDAVAVSDQGRSAADLRNLKQQEASTEGGDATSFDDPAGSAPAIADLEDGASIAQATAFLQLTYSYVKQAGLDTDEFIGAYTWRPIASLLDIFGTSDLQYSGDGRTVVQGYEGFHSRAVGPYEDLFGLVDEEVESLIGVKRGSTAAQDLDIRKARREKVESYLASLLFGNAILG